MNSAIDFTRSGHDLELDRWKSRLSLNYLLIPVTLLLAVACSDKDSTPVSGIDLVPTSIAIEPSSAVLLEGNTVQLKAVVKDQNGEELAGHSVQWSSSDEDVATVNSGGLVTAVQPESAIINASADGISNSIQIHVTRLNTSGRSSFLGINLGGIMDWYRDWAFVDVFKSSRQWISQRNGAGWGQGGDLDLTAEGWIASLQPNQWAVTPMLTGTGAQFPEGEYTVLYRGEGQLEFPLNEGSVQVKSQSRGRIVLDVTPRMPDVETSDALWVAVMETNPSDPIRDIRVILPGYEGSHTTQPFNITFLERAAKFAVIRFMGYQQMNDNPPGTWPERPQTDQATFTAPGGVPLEIMIQLANRLHTDPWFCIPHGADDDYVRSFAQMVRDQLDPELRVYLEYTNEAWNFIFPQADYVFERGNALGLSQNTYHAGWFYYARRSVEIFEIWNEVFESDLSRVVRVLAWQAAGYGGGELMMDFENAWEKADAIAIAPYFDAELSAGTFLPSSESQVISLLSDDIDSRVREWVAAYRKLADARGLSLIAYEGGQHLVASRFPNNMRQNAIDLFAAVNRNPQIGELYDQYFDMWKEEGGELMVPFSLTSQYGESGYWGALEYIDQDIGDAPKYQALQDFMMANPKPIR